MAGTEIFARSLVENREIVDGTTTVKDMVEWFRRYAQYDYVTIIQAGAIVGLAGRDQLNAKLAGKYGYSVLADKPITKVMIENPLTVDGGYDLQQLTHHLINSGRASNEFYYDIIVHENGEFLGLVSVKRLIISQTERILKQMDALHKQADVLAAKNRELFEATMRLDQSNSNFKAFFETCSIPIVILDCAGAFVQANPRFLKLAGFNPSELNSSTTGERLFVGGVNHVKGEYERSRADYGDRRPTYHLRLVKKSGEEIGVEISFDIDEATHQWIISIVRVTAQEELQLQRILDERLKNRGALARSVAANLIDRESDVEAMLKKFESVFQYAEQLERDSTKLVAGGQSLGPESAMTGDISTFSPIDLTQLLIQGRKTGELQLTNKDHQDGRVFFNTGRIVHAETEGVAGVDALRKLLKIESGSFCFLYDVLSPKHTIEGEPMYILLNTCAEIDEEELAEVV